MAKKKSEFLSAFGIVFEIWRALVEAVLDAGGSDDDLRRLGSDNQLRREIAALIVKARITFTVIVDYLTPSYDALRSSFDRVDPDFSRATFEPIDQCKNVARTTSEVAFEYLHLGRDASTDEVLAEMDKRGLRPATYEEALAFAKKNPDEQRKFPIVALGSVWRHPSGSRLVAYLGGSGAGRYLNLDWTEFDWSELCRFLAVRK